jgi:hypothetical protein
MTERKPMRAAVKTGDRVLIPCGRAEDENGNLVGLIYDEMLIAAGSCRIEYDGCLHIRIRRRKDSCILDANRDNSG